MGARRHNPSVTQMWLANGTASWHFMTQSRGKRVSPVEKLYIYIKLRVSCGELTLYYDNRIPPPHPKIDKITFN